MTSVEKVFCGTLKEHDSMKNGKNHCHLWEVGYNSRKGHICLHYMYPWSQNWKFVLKDWRLKKKKINLLKVWDVNGVQWRCSVLRTCGIFDWAFSVFFMKYLYYHYILSFLSLISLWYSLSPEWQIVCVVCDLYYIFAFVILYNVIIG